MAKERVIPKPQLERMLERLAEGLQCGNRAVIRARLADFIAGEHEEGPVILAITPTNVWVADG